MIFQQFLHVPVCAFYGREEFVDDCFVLGIIVFPQRFVKAIRAFLEIFDRVTGFQVARVAFLFRMMALVAV